MSDPYTWIAICGLSLAVILQASQIGWLQRRLERLEREEKARWGRETQREGA